MTNRRLFRIVLASPADVLAERDLVQNAVAELDKSIASDRGLQLEICRWETDAYPGFHPEGPQGLIDRTLRIEDSDLLIGIFWTRFGTPVKDARSGTEHEFRLAYEAWKKNGRPQIMVYFNERPYAAKSKRELEQWGAVLEFRSNFPQEGLWWPYNDTAEFERLVRTHLTRLISGLIPLENRTAYIERYARLIGLANTEIILYHSKLHRTQDRPEAQLINDALRSAMGRGVRVRILLADGYDRLPAAIELQNNLGAEVRFDPAIHLSDLNYVCADKRQAILAIRTPSDRSKEYVPTTSSVELNSNFLASSLWTEFDRRWDSFTTRTIGLHMREILPRVIDASNIDAVCWQLGLPLDVIERYRRPRAFVVFLIGRPGSGKSTVARQIVAQAPSTGIFSRPSHVSDLEYLRKAFAVNEDENVRFQRTQDGGFFILDSVLYSEALEYLAEKASKLASANDLLVVEFARNSYADAFQLLSENGLEADLVAYLDVSLETALKRNRQRVFSERGDKHFVSEREMRETYATDDIESLAEKHQNPLMILRNENDSVSVGKERASEIMRRMREIF